MPLGAMLKSTLLIGVKSMTRQPTGEWKPSYDFSQAVGIPCRVYDTSLKSRQRQFGNTLEIDLRVKIPLSAGIEPYIYDPNGSARQQVQVDGILYEVLWCRTPGNVGRYKELYLKRWK